MINMTNNTNGTVNESTPTFKKLRSLQEHGMPWLNFVVENYEQLTIEANKLK